MSHSSVYLKQHLFLIRLTGVAVMPMWYVSVSGEKINSFLASDLLACNHILVSTSSALPNKFSDMNDSQLIS